VQFVCCMRNLVGAAEGGACGGRSVQRNIRVLSQLSTCSKILLVHDACQTCSSRHQKLPKNTHLQGRDRPQLPACPAVVQLPGWRPCVATPQGIGQPGPAGRPAAGGGPDGGQGAAAQRGRPAGQTRRQRHKVGCAGCVLTSLTGSARAWHRVNRKLVTIACIS
jgi:hypothetical protein